MRLNITRKYCKYSGKVPWFTFKGNWKIVNSSNSNEEKELLLTRFNRYINKSKSLLKQYFFFKNVCSAKKEIVFNEIGESMAPVGALIINMKKQILAEFLQEHSTSKVLLTQKGEKNK